MLILVNNKIKKLTAILQAFSRLSEESIHKRDEIVFPFSYALLVIAV
ncbi:hypothetical protein SAMN05444338_107205 [Flavobacterium degerlachei]|uniref:Uncharacterized protein n=1 Tax=Flavobacterium degerlachei TaxID=229203 RepID=A0A1H2ZIB9_9FLAO|nr:hypothetical protein SAMN05444338_107205 [Flavobacterium degerlachei]